MAIERAEESSEIEMNSPMEMDGEELPMSLTGGKDISPGDVVRIQVVSVDPENGTWRGKYAETAPKRSAIDMTAAGEEMEA
jgi:hypothetical protein